ncbi:MAG: DNA ligase [Lachnospiraceae bacterium]
MMDLFEDRNIAPMLIANMEEPFDNPEWIYELKLDGCRCMAYLDEAGVVLRNKRNVELLPRFPELSDINKCAKQRCVLDGELIVLVNGRPDFYELQKRTLLTSKTKIKLDAGRHPASFVAFDCLQSENRILLDVPLLERKQILQNLIRENERMAISRFFTGKGKQLFTLTVEKELEGVVAKRASSLYYPGKRTKDWIKFKRMADRDFVICGFISGNASGGMVTLLLGEYREGKLSYAGNVSLGVRKEVLRHLQKGPCPFQNGKTDNVNPENKIKNSLKTDKNNDIKNRGIVWCKPNKICVVEYMPNTKDSLRQPVYKGLRND